MTFLKMTIRSNQAGQCQVFQMKRELTGYSTDMASRKESWFVSRAAQPRFTGTHEDCAKYINAQCAEYMSEFQG